MTQLNTLIGTKSAARDGVLMQDTDGNVVVSVGGVWEALQMASLTAPDGGRWRLVVDNAGNLSTAAA